MAYLSPSIVIILSILMSQEVTSSNRCDDTVYRCPYGQTCLHYKGKSDLGNNHHFGHGFDIRQNGNLHPHRICLDTDGVCASVLPYSGHRHGSSSGLHQRYSEHCSSSHVGDGSSCSDHGQCLAVDGGIAICCHHKCVHVHNVPCVRNFLREEDRLCDDDNWHNHFEGHNKHNYGMTAQPQHQEKCGVPGVGTVDQFITSQMTQIVGGNNATTNQICWQAIVQLSTGLSCGGTIIGSQTIMTTAFCAKLEDANSTALPSQITVGIGALSVTGNQSGTLSPGCGEVFTVSKVVIHPDYDFDTGDNDIALITLQHPIDLLNKPCACALCLRDKTPSPGDSCFSSGMGTELTSLQEANGISPDANTRPLKWLAVSINNQSKTDVCPSAIEDNFPPANLDLLVCAGGDVGQGVCGKDGGDPLFCYDSDNKSHYAAGIKSFDGSNCPEDGAIQFTKVHKYLSWIKTNSVSGNIQVL